jgi:rubrerythrin
LDTVDLIAELNDLIQLDIDAVQAYALAMALARDGSIRETLARFRGDHERHVRTLADLVQARGGRPAVLPHLPTGILKLTVQAAGIIGGDRGVLLALQANEAQAQEKYERHSGRRHPPDIAATLQQQAADERAHYAWVSHTVAAMGAGPGTMIGSVAQAFGAVHSATADMIEAAQRLGAASLERAWRVRR